MKPAHATTQEMLLLTFLEESFEGLERLEAGLLELDAGVSSERIDDLFRVVHSMKGGAAAIGVGELVSLVHAMEGILDGLRRGEPLAADTSSALLRGVDAIRTTLGERQAGRVVALDAHAELTALLERYAARSHGRSAPAARPLEAPGDWRIDLVPGPELMRGGTDPLKLLRALGELGPLAVTAELDGLPDLDALDPAACYLRWQIRLAGAVPRAAIDDLFGWLEGPCEVTIRRAEPTPGPAEAPSAPAAAGDEAGVLVAGAGSTIRVDIDKIDQLMNMVGELVITQSMLGELDGDGPIDAARLARIREGLGQLARNTRALQDSVMRLRSMPMSTVFKRLPRLVHDLGKQLGKEVELEIAGENTELDKAVLEHLGDPLVHLVRNCVDHGIEPAGERLAAGKPRAGRIRVSAEHRGGDVVVEISDDGRGLDSERILATARRRGLVAPGVALDEHAMLQLVIQPGFSTATEVTSVSGRGVGMDVVHRHVEDLGGDVSLASERGRGVRIALRLPLTLATIDGQLIRAGAHTFVIPLLSITESVVIDPRHQSRLGGACEVYRLRQQLIPMIELAALLGLPGAHPGHHDRRMMVIVSATGGPLGFVVDELLAQQQVVVKSLETNYQRVAGLAGATILGDGRVAFILDVAALAQLARSALPTAA